MSRIWGSILRSAAIAATLAASTIWANGAAAAIVYPNIGVENTQTYSFTAASTGDLVAYFAGSGAAFENQLGLLVNSISTGLVGLNNHESAIGQAFNFGRVEAGDVLTFVDFVTDYATWFSDPALNEGNGNHIYSTTAAAGEAFNGSPAGTYVAFEDLRFPNSDFNYFDHAFVFTVAAVPEPATWAMIILGFAVLGLRSGIASGAKPLSGRRPCITCRKAHGFLAIQTIFPASSANLNLTLGRGGRRGHSPRLQGVQG